MDDYDTRITQRLHRPKLCFSMNEVVKHIGEMMIEYMIEYSAWAVITT